MTKFYWLSLAILCVWRITHLLHAEHGPWEVLERLRQRAGTGFWGSLLDCFYCLSVWVAAPLALVVGETVMEKILLWPALSGAACLLQKAVHRDSEAPPAAYWEDDQIDDEEIHHVLRTTEQPLPEAFPTPPAAAER